MWSLHGNMKIPKRSKATDRFWNSTGMTPKGPIGKSVQTDSHRGTGTGLEPALAGPSAGQLCRLGWKDSAVLGEQSASKRDMTVHTNPRATAIGFAIFAP